ncbi:MAG: hypothetical protein V8R24_03075 [Dorea longicatena]
MRIKEGQIFNLMDTNGRRNDVINALQGYLTILDDIQNEQKMNWASMPESLAQYEFYRQAIELSPEVFGKHGPYDKLAETLERNKDFATAVQTQDMEWIQKNSFMFQSLVKQFDLGIEDRATDNVVIMPVNTDELSSLIDKSSEYDEIISKVHKLFEVDKINFDIEWREKFMGAII